MHRPKGQLGLCCRVEPCLCLGEYAGRSLGLNLAVGERPWRLVVGEGEVGEELTGPRQRGVHGAIPTRLAVQSLQPRLDVGHAIGSLLMVDFKVAHPLLGLIERTDCAVVHLRGRDVLFRQPAAELCLGLQLAPHPVRLFDHLHQLSGHFFGRLCRQLGQRRLLELARPLVCRGAQLRVRLSRGVLRRTGLLGALLSLERLAPGALHRRGEHVEAGLQDVLHLTLTALGIGHKQAGSSAVIQIRSNALQRRAQPIIGAEQEVPQTLAELPGDPTCHARLEQLVELGTLVARHHRHGRDTGVEELAQVVGDGTTPREAAPGYGCQALQSVARRDLVLLAYTIEQHALKRCACGQVSDQEGVQLTACPAGALEAYPSHKSIPRRQVEVERRVRVPGVTQPTPQPPVL